MGFMWDTADAKVLELDQCTGKFFTFSSQVDCYKLAIKLAFIQILRPRKLIVVVFKIVVLLTSQGLCPDIDVLSQPCLRLF